MKHKLLFATFFIAFCFSTTFAQEVVLIGGDKLNFTLPDGFKLLSHNDEVPSYSYANELKTISLEVFVPGVQLVPEDLEKHKEVAIVLTELSFPNLKWLNREIINRGGRKWIYLSYEAKNQNNETIHFDYYIASIELSLVSVMFVLKASESERYKDTQQEVIKSFRFHRKAASNNSLNVRAKQPLFKDFLP